MKRDHIKCINLELDLTEVALEKTKLKRKYEMGPDIELDLTEVNWKNDI